MPISTDIEHHTEAGQLNRPPLFPVTVEMRNPGLSIEVQADGRVVSHCTNRPSVIIAHHAPTRPGFSEFMEFWGRTFALRGKRSLALNQLVVDLAAGRIEPDFDCPHLFIDKSREEELLSGDIIFPVLEVTADGAVREYNPDEHFLNEAYALANNPRVKVFANIGEDMDGNDVVTGMRVGTTKVPGAYPVFDRFTPKSAAADVESASNIGSGGVHG